MIMTPKQEYFKKYYQEHKVTIIRRSSKYHKEHPEQVKEYKRKYKQTLKGKETDKRYRQSPKGKNTIRKAQKKYSQSPKCAKRFERYSQSIKGKRTVKRYSKSIQGKEAQKRYLQSSKGKESRRKVKAKRRQLGFTLLNKWFKGSEGHHIDFERVIYIPKELHHGVWHSLFLDINMDKINKLAFEFTKGRQN